MLKQVDRARFLKINQAPLAGSLCRFTGGSDFAASLRHHCVSTDELSVGPEREGRREHETRRWERDPENEQTEGERERGVAASETLSRIKE